MLTPTWILLLGSRAAVTPLVCSGTEVAVAAEAVVLAGAAVVLRVWKTEPVVGPETPGTAPGSGASSPVGPHAMNSASVVGRLPRRSKPPRPAACRCLLPLRRRACWSTAHPPAAAGARDEAEAPRAGPPLAAAGGLASPPLGTRPATWSLGLCARLARGLCIGPWLRSTRAGRGLHTGAGTLAGCPLFTLHRRRGRCGGRGRSRNSGPGPRASHAGRSSAS